MAMVLKAQCRHVTKRGTPLLGNHTIWLKKQVVVGGQLVYSRGNWTAKKIRGGCPIQHQAIHCPSLYFLDRHTRSAPYDGFQFISSSNLGKWNSSAIPRSVLTESVNYADGQQWKPGTDSFF